jgi:hypothetical protein
MTKDDDFTRKAKRMKSTISRTSMAVGAFALALAVTTKVALAESYPPPNLLAAQWWQWALSAPASSNPLLDTTGQFAAVNQRGRIWFLAGNTGGETTRYVTVPAGKALFFPIVNQFDVEHGIEKGVGPVFMAHQPLQTAQAFVSQVIATATNLSCVVDGSPLTIDKANLEQSTPFSVFLPADNIFGGASVGVPAGVYAPAVDSGYYVLLPPLSSGPHTIHFAGTVTATNFSLDVTYYLVVQ